MKQSNGIGYRGIELALSQFLAQLGLDPAADDQGQWLLRVDGYRIRLWPLAVGGLGMQTRVGELPQDDSLLVPLLDAMLNRAAGHFYRHEDMLVISSDNGHLLLQRFLPEDAGCDMIAAAFDGLCDAAAGFRCYFRELSGQQLAQDEDPPLAAGWDWA